MIGCLLYELQRVFETQNLKKMRSILKKTILFTTLLLGSVITTSTFAEELKRSCVKDNPLVAGESDPTLLQVYSQVCDKKNKDNKNSNLVLAAQRFQQLGQNEKALQLVSELNANQFQHTALTDVKFLAGLGIANEALKQIREKEVRYLSDDEYAPAIAFSEAVRKAKPMSVIETPVVSVPVSNVKSGSSVKNNSGKAKGGKISNKTGSGNIKTGGAKTGEGKTSKTTGTSKKIETKTSGTKTTGTSQREYPFGGM